ncbi:GA module-containing protein, partial [Escherichia coli]|nr:GA module-containing protein [Escherichia coli]
QVNNTKVALDGDENLAVAKQQANNRLDQLDHLNNAQKQQLHSQITQSSDIAAVNGHKQTAESLNTAMGNLKQAIADKDATKATVNFTDADQAKQQAYNTAVTNAENIISKANGGNATQTEVEQAPDIATVNNVKQNAQNLNNAMTNLSNALQDKTETLNSINFTDADQ